MCVGALVVYKRAPAKVVSGGEKIVIEREDGSTVSVRGKDIEPLHPGPVRALAELAPAPVGEPVEAWELLKGQGGCGLRELAELVFGCWTPSSAFAAWRLCDDGLYFQGNPARIEPRAPEQVEKTLADRRRRREVEEEWGRFIERLRNSTFSAEDAPRLAEIESLARGRGEASRALRDLSIAQTPENAHALLLRIGRWTRFVNPHPSRLGARLEPPPDSPIAVPDEHRVDLTHLDTFAIDDDGNTDPDDAVSLEGDRVWIHVADPAVCALPDSPLDIEARARGVTLYLPERIIPMFPTSLVGLFGLGLAEVSPALSFGVRLDDDAGIADIEVVPSFVKARRLSYTQADALLDEPPLARLREIGERRRRRRMDAGAVELELPEVRIKVGGDTITVDSFPISRSRSMVAECMLLAGEAASRFASAHDFVLPFVAQPPSGEPCEPSASLAAMFQRRRRMKRNRVSAVPAPHAGLGLESYARVTSPLRRYADLLAHQQIRAHLAGASTFTAEEIGSRITATEAVIDAARQSERKSDAHWTLAYLAERPGWRGAAVLVDRFGGTCLFLIPSIAYEAKISAGGDLRLDDEVELTLNDVDLPFLTASFSVAKR